MEQDRKLTSLAPVVASETAATVNPMSLVDCLFAMPAVAKKRPAGETGARLEARLSSEIRTLIAARLRNSLAA